MSKSKATEDNVVSMAVAIENAHTAADMAHSSLAHVVKTVGEAAHRNPDRYALAEADQVLTLALLAVANAKDVLERICEETALDN